MGEALWWIIDLNLPAILLIALVWLASQRRSNSIDRLSKDGSVDVYGGEE